MPKFFLCLLVLLGHAVISSAASPVSSTDPEAKDDYKLAPSDVLIMELVGEGDTKQEQRVSSSGTIIFPFLGEVFVKGKTRSEVVAELQEKLKPDYFVNPQVVIEVKEYSKRTVTVLGQVVRQGTFQFPSEQGLNLLEAIGLAEGFAKSANRNKIHITRNGKQIEFNLRKWQDGDDKEKLPKLEPGDVVEVPETVF